jgi:hypothetical protein
MQTNTLIVMKADAGSFVCQIYGKLRVCRAPEAHSKDQKTHGKETTFAVRFLSRRTAKGTR